MCNHRGHWCHIPQGWTATHYVLSIHAYIVEKEVKSRHLQTCRLTGCSLSPQNYVLLLRNTIENSPHRLSGCNSEANGTKNPTLSPLWVVSGSRPRRTGRVCSDPARSRSIFPCLGLFSLSLSAGWRRGGMKLVWQLNQLGGTFRTLQSCRPDPRLRVVRVPFPANQSKRKHLYVIKRGGWWRKGLINRFGLKMYLIKFKCIIVIRAELFRNIWK